MDAGGAGGGNYAGLVAIAAVSAAVTLATVQLYRCIEADFRKKIQLLHGATGRSGVTETMTKKKVRFAGDVVEPSSNNEEYRRRRVRSTVVAAGRAYS